jgi:hypothetical protein
MANKKVWEENACHSESSEHLFEKDITMVLTIEIC